VKLWLVTAALSLVLVVVLGGCNRGNDAPDGGTARERAVTAIVDNVIAPSYQAVDVSSAALSQAVADLCAAPSIDTIAGARTATGAAWSAWEHTETFDVGPAVARRSNTYVAYRVAPGRVDVLLNGTPPADADAARNRTASNQRGYGAIDHLLAADDPAQYPGARCVYLTALTDLVAEESAALADAWAGEGREEVLAMNASDVIDDLINMQVSFLEATVRTYDDGTDPTRSEALEIPGALVGMADVYTAGLDGLLTNALARTVHEEINAALARSVADAAPAIEALRATIATEVVSALDVTVGFSENDGDS